MVQRGEDAGLAFEPYDAFGVGGASLRQDLDRDVAIEPAPIGSWMSNTPTRRPVRLDTALFCTSLRSKPAVCEHRGMPETSPLTTAPSFALKSASGETRTLDALLERARVLLIFHRGTW
jgi:hypothetical protein